MAESVSVLEEILHKIAKENQFTDYGVKIKLIPSEGANYTSQLYLATISNSSRNLSLFAKVISLSDKMRLQGFDIILEREPFVYTTLSKIYRQLEEKHNVPIELMLKFPKFYGQNPTRGKEVLVLEDLTARGFKLYDRSTSLNWPYAFKTVKELARLHALSFSFEFEQPEEFKNVEEKVKFNLLTEENVQVVMNLSLEKAYSVIKGKNLDKVKDFFAKPNSTNFIEYMKPSRRGVLGHGDFRMSNTMYKIDEEGMYEVMILDYQTLTYISPVADLLNFIFTGTDEGFRSKHYLALLDQYYAQLSLAMRRLGLKPDDIYSKEDFDYEVEQKLPFGFAVAVMALPLLMAAAEDIPKMDKDSDFSSLATTKNGKLYPERLNGIVNDFVRWRVL